MKKYILISTLCLALIISIFNPIIITTTSATTFQTAIKSTGTILQQKQLYNQTVYTDDEGNYFSVNEQTGQIYSSSNATETINNALTSVSGEEWETVYLKGTFIIDNPILIKDYTILKIDGTIILEGNTNNIMIQNIDQTNGNNHLKIIGGELNGNREKQNIWSIEDNHAILFSNVKDVEISNMHIHNPIRIGIRVEGDSQNIRIYNNTLRDSRYGIYFVYPVTDGGMKDIEVCNNYLDHFHREPEDNAEWGGDGIFLQGTPGKYIQNIKVENNYVSRCRDAAIEVNHVRDGIINNNQFTDCATGVLIRSSNYLTVQLNKYDKGWAIGGIRDGIFIDGITPNEPSYMIDIKKNIINNPPDVGIDININSIEINVEENIITNAITTAGIRVQQDVFQNPVPDNVTANVIIANNTIDEINANGIAVWITDGYFISEVKIIDNLVKNCAGNGIHMDRTLNYTIHHNLIENITTGIQQYSNTDYGTITKNTILNFTYAATVLTGIHNIISENTGF